MSTAFEARFSTSPLDLAHLLEVLELALPTCGLRFLGSVMRLRSHDDWPTVTGTDFEQVDSMAEAAEVASRWWGIGIECISDALLQGLGRTDAVEVYLSIFRAQDGRWTASYLESSRAADHRIESDSAARNLSTLQMTLCAAGRFDLSIYDEENHERDPIPTLREVEVAIKRVVSDPGAGDLSVVVSSELIGLEHARRLAGPRAGRVELSTTGYTVFRLLPPEM